MAIDRIFEVLAATYGAEFTRLYADVPIGDVKTAWLDVLDAFGGPRMAYIAWALKNLPERCPNAIAFRNLCRQAPALEAPQLPEPKADPERLRAELARLQPLREAIAASSPVDHKAWARRLVARQEAGERINRTVLGMARSALRLGA